MGVPACAKFSRKILHRSRRRHSRSFGRLFKNDLRLYVYPAQDPATGSIITAATCASRRTSDILLLPAGKSFHPSIQDYNDAFCRSSREVLAKIQAGDSRVEIMCRRKSRTSSTANIVRVSSSLRSAHCPGPIAHLDDYTRLVDWPG